MKKCLAVMCLVCLTLFLLSGPAFASLYAGTWNQTTPYQIELGTWSETAQGSNPTWVGSIGSQDSVGTQWNASSIRGNSTYTTPTYKDGYYQMDFVTAFDQWAFNCIFVDGNEYTANLSGTATYTLYLNYTGNPLNPFVYDHAGPIHFYGEGNVVGNPFLATYDGMGTMTDYNPGVSWGGDITSLELSLSPLSSVPIPGAVWLMGSGLLGLLGIRRKLIW